MTGDSTSTDTADTEDVTGDEPDGVERHVLADGGESVKMVGELDVEGTGVLGEVTATSGTNYGVKGTVDSGYGLYTPDDAKIDGTVDGGVEWRVEVADGLDIGNVVQGDPQNSVDPDSYGQTVGGGGDNTASGDYATVGGGGPGGYADEGNEASGELSTVSGGGENVASELSTTVSGGRDNRVIEQYSTIGGGIINEVNGSTSTIGGGVLNEITGSISAATIGGGSRNTVAGKAGTVSGGEENASNDEYATVAGGERNEALAQYATVAGGGPSDSDNPDTTNNVVYDNYGTIGGGGNNQAGVDDSDSTTAEYATVAGGDENTASGTKSTVGGGAVNTASALHSTVAGGVGNTASVSRSTVAGGSSNTASNTHSTVGGGWGNTASGSRSTVPGGRNNVADGDHSFAAGREAKANHNGAIVFGDSSDTEITSDGLDEARFQMPIYAEAFNTTSARAAKTGVAPVDPQAALEGVQSLEVSTWEFTDADSGRHMGPMAEEFADTFDLGDDDESIATVDADGVLFAAVQGLAKELEEARETLAEKDERIESQAERIDDLEDRFAALEARVDGADSTPADD